MTLPRISLRVVLGVALVTAMLPLLGQTAEPSPEDIAAQLQSDDASQRAAALAAIRGRIEENPRLAATYIRTLWLAPLVDKNRYQPAIDLCIAGICASPEQIGNVEFLQRRRVELLRASGQHDDALAQAKALFNLISMPATSQALLTIAECADEAFGNDSPFVDHLIDEEHAGMVAADGRGVVSNTMRSIHINPSPYADALRRFRLPSGDLPIAPGDLLAVGNLSLLADDGQAAQAAFEKLAQVGPPDQVHIAREGVARAIRAEDGTIGRANHYLEGK